MFVYGIAVDFEDDNCDINYRLTAKDIAKVTASENGNSFYPLLLEHDHNRQVGEVTVVVDGHYLYATGYIWDSIQFMKDLGLIAKNYSQKRTLCDDIPCPVTTSVVLQMLYPNLSLGVGRSTDFKIIEVSLVGLGARTNTVVTYGTTVDEICDGVLSQIPTRALHILRQLECSTITSAKDPSVTDSHHMSYLIADSLYYQQIDERRDRLKTEFQASRFDDTFLTASVDRKMNNPDLHTIYNDVSRLHKAQVQKKNEKEQALKQTIRHVVSDIIVEQQQQQQRQNGPVKKRKRIEDDGGDNKNDDDNDADDDDDDDEMTDLSKVITISVAAALKQKKADKRQKMTPIKSPDDALRQWYEEQQLKMRGENEKLVRTVLDEYINDRKRVEDENKMPPPPPPPLVNETPTTTVENAGCHRPIKDPLLSTLTANMKLDL